MAMTLKDFRILTANLDSDVEIEITDYMFRDYYLDRDPEPCKRWLATSLDYDEKGRRILLHTGRAPQR